MEALNDFFTQQEFDVPGICTVGNLLLESSQLLVTLEAQQIKITPHHLIRNRHQFAEHFIWRFSNTDIIVQRLGHFLHAIKTFQQRQRNNDLGFLTIVLLQMPPDQQIKLLIGSAHFHIGFQHH